MENKDGMPQIELILEGKDDDAKVQDSSGQIQSAPGHPPAQSDEMLLSEKEKIQAMEFAKKIDLMNTNQILQYGNCAQKKISDFSESALSKVMTKDMGQVGDILTQLTVELQGFEAEEKPRKGLLGFLKKTGNQLNTLRTRYASVETNITRITDSLEGHKIQLLKDISIMDKMYEMNFAYYKELTMYLVAGKARLKEALEVEAPALKEKAKTSGLPQDVQIARDFADRCERFEKKIHDLELTRSICLQMAPQIRLVQNNDSIIVEKIQSSIINTIPLWKNHMVLALGIAHTQKAVEAQRAVTDVTNELLKRNADMLKTSTIETAKESQRSIVSIETVRHINRQLISTIEEVIQIQKEGRKARQAAETELNNIETELKQKLLENV